MSDTPRTDEETPPELLAGKLIDAWVSDKGKRIPWAKAIQIVAIVTKQPDAERDRLLRMGEDDGSCEMCGRNSIDLERDLATAQSDLSACERDRAKLGREAMVIDATISMMESSDKDATEQPCAGCGKPLLLENAWMEDGCPCNTPAGVNNLNLYRWKLLHDLQQKDSRDLAAAQVALAAEHKAADLIAEERDSFESGLKDARAKLATCERDTIERILRGLRSEDDSVQLRAIIASVEALKPEQARALA